MLPTPDMLEGRPVPNVSFKVRRDDRWQELTTDEIFAGRTVVAFGLPGAFTPTCSNAHLPRYNELAPTFRECGVDDIVCIAVNDCFVMEQWQREQHADAVRMIPDGNGEFTRAMELLVDKSAKGLGLRSWRYSMLVRNAVIEKVFIESEREGDPFEVSDADTMLRYVNPGAEPPPAIVIFGKHGCPYCARARSLLDGRGYRYQELFLGEDFDMRILRAVAGASTTPQVFVDGTLIGNGDALAVWLERSAPERKSLAPV